MNEPINIESLIVKYLNETISDEEFLELTAWINQSKENELAFNQVREILLVSRVDDENFQFDVQVALERIRKKTRIADQPIPRFRNIKPKKYIRLSYRWAAAIAILVVVGGIWLYNWSRMPMEHAMAYQEITVPLGSRSKVVLPDGSHVTLNAGSTLRYQMNFGMERRDIWLDGEGFFVVHKSSIPFVVHSGSVQVKAVGTSFNVRAYSSENNIETTLVEGKVIITDTENRQVRAEEVTLLPNQKLTISKTKKIDLGNDLQIAEKQTNKTSNEPIAILGEGVILHDKIDPTPQVSWKDNKWIIDREDLGSLAGKLEKRFDIHITFKDEQLKSYRYNGSLPDLSLEQVLNIMSMVSPIHYSVNGKAVVFTENKEYKTQKR